MANSHRADGRMWVNPEHTENPPERAARATPETYQEKGVNFPYRGVETHGVPYTSTIPDELEGRQYSEEMPLPPHYMPEPKKPIPVPVRLVTDTSCERKMWDSDQYTVFGPDAQTGLMILGRSDDRSYVIIRNLATSGNVYIGATPNVTPQNGYPIPAGTDTPRIYTTEAIYCIGDTATQSQVGILWEYSVSV